MLRRSSLAIGFGYLAFALAVIAMPSISRSAYEPQAKGHDGQPKVEAEAGHGGPSRGGTEAHSSAETNPMQVQPALAFWTFIVFILLFFVLSKYAWKPLSQALHQREEHIEHALLQTEKARNESEQLLAEHRRLMAQADERVKAILDQAHTNAQATADHMIRLAQAEAEAARDRAQREIATARDQALSEIWSQTANIAVSVAERVLTKELGPDEHRRLLDLAIKELPAAPVSPNGDRGSHT
jgi:F-type H+-transporting ATPase subunit b